ncbi:hypothetical protein [Stenotrophomonas sp. PS02301]|uniref:hypothetical protein n=1 Tax=Stenotrophomonas sp. PS02301 TaxID=2991427 RepID=UPI00249AAC65|nr:hypothetical protein [Stenotrophomonas sp. PS02301]
MALVFDAGPTIDESLNKGAGNPDIVCQWEKYFQSKIREYGFSDKSLAALDQIKLASKDIRINFGKARAMK